MAAASSLLPRCNKAIAITLFRASGAGEGNFSEFGEPFRAGFLHEELRLQENSRLYTRYQSRKIHIRKNFDLSGRPPKPCRNSHRATTIACRVKSRREVIAKTFGNPSLINCWRDELPRPWNSLQSAAETLARGSKNNWRLSTIAPKELDGDKGNEL